MRLCRHVLVFLLVMSVGGSDDDEAADEKKKVLRLTKEWRKVPPGYAVPRGAHVRMNLHTKEVEAKEYESEETKTDLVAVEDMLGEGGSQMEETLKSLTTAEEANRKEHVGEKWRTYEQLQQEKEDGMKEKKGVPSSRKIMTHMIKRYTATTSEDEIVSVLSDLQHLCHRYPDALEFAHQGGLSIVALHSLNHTSATVRTMSGRLLGAAMQSNPEVQVVALESGAERAILVSLSKETDADATSSLVFALSAMLRRFPVAQSSVLRQGGLAVLSSIFGANGTKIRLKIATLLADLVLEPLFETKDPKKLRQYRELQLEARLKEGGWCELITLPRDAEHDQVEQSLHVLAALSGVCRSEFKQHRSKLVSLKRAYAESEDDYLTSISKLASDVLAKLDIPEHEEL